MVEQRVDHRVAHEMDRRGIDSLAHKIRYGACRMREEDRAEVIGEPAILLLWHRVVEAAESGLDVRNRNVELCRGECRAERRIDIACYYDQGGSELDQNLLHSDERPRRLFRVRA